MLDNILLLILVLIELILILCISIWVSTRMEYYMEKIEGYLRRKKKSFEISKNLFRTKEGRYINRKDPEL